MESHTKNSKYMSFGDVLGEWVVTGCGGIFLKRSEIKIIAGLRIARRMALWCCVLMVPTSKESLLHVLCWMSREV